MIEAYTFKNPSYKKWHKIKPYLATVFEVKSEKNHEPWHTFCIFFNTEIDVFM